MKFVVVLSFSLALTACVPVPDKYEPRVTWPDVAYIGDSLCWGVWDVEKWHGWLDIGEDKQTAQNLTGIVSFCTRGRKISGLIGLPQTFNKIFLALGTNDIGRTPLDQFREQYEAVVSTSSAKNLYCVLPNKTVRGIDAEPYRQVIRSICAEVIDPVEYGVLFLAKDTVHMTRTDHRRATKFISERL